MSACGSGWVRWVWWTCGGADGGDFDDNGIGEEEGLCCDVVKQCVAAWLCLKRHRAASDDSDVLETGYEVLVNVFVSGGETSRGFHMSRADKTGADNSCFDSFHIRLG